MDFLNDFNDQILTDLDRADYVGGIDNEAIFFEDLQGTTALGRLGPDGNHNSASNASGIGSENSILSCTTKTETPVTSPLPMTSIGHDIILPSLPTVSARVSLTAAAPTPHIGIHHNSSNNSATHTHLPESPPDSGSEPPYSPLQDVQGLTVNTRDIFHHNGGGNGVGNVTASVISELHMQMHHASPTPQYQEQHHYPHLLDGKINIAALASAPTQDIVSNAGANGGSIRIKNETGLIINPNSLTQTLNISQTLHAQTTDTHVEIISQQQQQHQHHQQQTQLMYNNNNHHHNHNTNNQISYDTLSNKLYSGNNNLNITNSTPPAPPPPYQINMNHIENSVVDTSPCMLTTVGDLPHVQVVGTSIPSTPTLSRTSAPSTPNHQSSSRKRKMTTQIDDPDFTCVKPDPGLILSPSRSSMCSTPLLTDATKRSSISPLNIQLNNHDMIDTPAPSNASLSPALSSVNMDGSVKNGDTTSQSGDALSPCIRFSPFQQQNWHKLCDQHLQDISVVYYRVDADKGFNFSVSDDAFVCQKKNHFQITCHARLQNDAKFVRTPSGLEKIKSFHLHFYGVKLEAPNQTIRIEQSQSDRSKKPFFPVPIDLQSHIVSKVTVGRLHFSETTNNNMRKKGRPNPEQRYFQLIVALHVHTASGDFPIISQGSDKIIVRASNPGQFESDVDLCWQRGLTQDSIYHAGRVGINTDRPDESLVVHGNLKISGHIVQPSDSRAKQEISELDTSVQLRNLQKIRIVRYRLEPQFALHSGLKNHKDSGDIVDTGVIAQEVREVIPDAVQEAGSVVLPNGNIIENFLLVNKDRILMENIGAVKELCKVTGTLETRIENLEKVNTHLQRSNHNDLQFLQCKSLNNNQDGYEICSNRTLQIIIFLLVIVMAACLAAVSTLYFVEHNKKQQGLKYLDSIQLLNNGHIPIYGHEGLTLTEQEHNLINMLKSAKNHTHWPTLTYQSSVSSSGVGTLGVAESVSRSQSHNATEYQRAELRYFGTSDDSLMLSSSQPLRNDEITVVMEKPSVGHEILQIYNEPQKVTTVPTLARNNKTAISKHKNKWPQPQIVLRVMQSAIHRNALPSTRSLNINGQTIEDIAPHNASYQMSETSTEKNMDVQQDFENNSIDTDSQQQGVKRLKSSPPKLHISASKEATHSEIQNLNADLPIVNTSSSNIIDETGLVIENSVTQSNILKHTNPKVGELIIYKTVSPPTSTSTITTTNSNSITNKVNTDAPHTNHSLENQSISNKSRSFVDRTTDNSDLLQQLSNDNNESIYSATDIIGNPVDFILGLDDRQSLLDRRATSSSSSTNGVHQSTNVNAWVHNSIVYVDTFGEPEQCNSKTKREDISNCQTVCFEENNQLSAPSQSNFNLKPPEVKKFKTSLRQEEIDNENHSDSEDNDAIIHETDDDLQSTFDGGLKNKETLNTSILVAPLTSKATHGIEALGKQQKTEIQRAEDAENLDILLEHNFSDENLDEAVKKEKKDDSLLQPKISVDPDLPPTNTDCWKIRSCIWAERLNSTFASEDFCPKLGKSENFTFIIPLSRFFKEQSIELHLTSSIPLQWVLCNIHEHSRSNIKHLTNSSPVHPSQNVLQRRRNTSLLLLNVPSRGYFVKDLILRATNDPNKSNVCQEQPHESNTILQYNFRILRNCD